jgi:guanylate kinase
MSLTAWCPPKNFSSGPSSRETNTERRPRRSASRLTGRGTEPPEVVDRRLRAAREELAAAGEFDVTLVNTSVDEVCRQMVTLIVSLVNP